MLKKKILGSFGIANISVTVSALALCLIPLCSTDSKAAADRVFSIAVAAVFWLGVIVSQIFIWICNAERKKYMYENNEDVNVGSIGILSFAKNKWGIVTDITFFVSAVAVIALYLARINNMWINIIAIAIMFLSFQYHCFWNGRIFCCIQGFISEAKGEK